MQKTNTRKKKVFLDSDSSAEGYVNRKRVKSTEGMIKKPNRDRDRYGNECPSYIHIDLPEELLSSPENEQAVEKAIELVNPRTKSGARYRDPDYLEKTVRSSGHYEKTGVISGSDVRDLPIMDLSVEEADKQLELLHNERERALKHCKEYLKGVGQATYFAAIDDHEMANERTILFGEPRVIETSYGKDDSYVTEAALARVMLSEFCPEFQQSAKRLEQLNDILPVLDRLQELRKEGNRRRMGL